MAGSRTALPRQPQIVDSGDMQVLADYDNGDVILRLLNRRGARVPEDWPLPAETARALGYALFEAAEAVQPQSAVGAN